LASSVSSFGAKVPVYIGSEFLAEIANGLFDIDDAGTAEKVAKAAAYSAERKFQGVVRFENFAAPKMS
jgi:hypothetical protein